MKQIKASEVVNEQDVERRLNMIAYKAQEARLNVLRVLHEKGTGHWGGAASSADVMNYLYYGRMNIDADDPQKADRDRFILSKGHASTMLYATLGERGYFPISELKTFREIDSNLQGHPCMHATPGVDMSTGALGHGISVGLGMALASSHSGKDFWTYIMVGEGCLQEGNSWEGIMAAAKFKPKRYVLLVDYNKVQLDGTVDDIMPLHPLKEKFESFNWTVAPKAYDGHDFKAIHESFTWLDEASSNGEAAGPFVIIYDTHKGKGVSHMEDDNRWHGAPIDKDNFEIAEPQILARLAELEAAL